MNEECKECYHYNVGDGCELTTCVYEEDKENKYTELEPSHYNAGKYDIIWFCEYHKLSFTVGNIIKYVFRAGKKDKSKEIEDLKKAKKYIDRRIEFLEGE